MHAVQTLEFPEYYTMKNDLLYVTDLLQYASSFAMIESSSIAQ